MVNKTKLVEFHDIGKCGNTYAMYEVMKGTSRAKLLDLPTIVKFTGVHLVFNFLLASDLLNRN